MLVSMVGVNLLLVFFIPIKALAGVSGTSIKWHFFQVSSALQTGTGSPIISMDGRVRPFAEEVLVRHCVLGTAAILLHSSSADPRAQRLAIAFIVNVTTTSTTVVMMKGRCVASIL
jgi:hypothetical protein